MSGAGLAFRWLDILEKEFDKSFVDLDISLADLESEEPDLVGAFRQHLGTLSSCWAQLSHKSQTVFQNSTKTEAELVNLRTELTETRAHRDTLQAELHSVLLQLHSSQAQRTSGDLGDLRSRLQEALEQSPSRRIEPSNSSLQLAQVRAQAAQWQKENEALRNTILALHSEVYGARLAAKYLDKELAGRIQQLQLLGREMKGALRDKLWRQLEAEILLQRHKTVVRACRSVSNSPSASTNPKSTKETHFISVSGRPVSQEPPMRGLGEPRHVLLTREAREGLGFSITGGREHGVPILISELEAGGPASRSQQLYVGDAILQVNNTDLQQASHQEAVAALQSVSGNCTLCVQFIAADSDDENSLSEDGYNFRYKFFEGTPFNPDCLIATPTAPRTPEPDNVTGIRKEDQYLDNGNNNKHIIALHDIPSRYTNSKPEAPPSYRVHDYESPMRQSTDSSDNLLSIVSSDESPKSCNNYKINSAADRGGKGQDAAMQLNDIEKTFEENIRKISSNGNSIYNSDDAVQNFKTELTHFCENFKKLHDNSGGLTRLQENSETVLKDLSKINLNYEKLTENFVGNYCDNVQNQYMYYETDCYSSVKNSLNSSLASTPVHKKRQSTKTSNAERDFDEAGSKPHQNVLDSPEITHGIRTIHQIFNKQLSLDNSHKTDSCCNLKCPDETMYVTKNIPDEFPLVQNINVLKTSEINEPFTDDVFLQSNLESVFEPKNAHDSSVDNQSNVLEAQSGRSKRHLEIILDPQPDSKCNDVKTALLVDNIGDKNSNLKSEPIQVFHVTDSVIETDRQRLQQCFVSKPRGLRIGYARRIAPKDDTVFIPLKSPDGRSTEDVQKHRLQIHKYDISDYGDLSEFDKRSNPTFDDNITSKYLCPEIESKMDVITPTFLEKTLKFDNLDTDYNTELEPIKKNTKIVQEKSAAHLMYKKNSYIDGRGDPGFGTPV